jgi:biotin carboxylase
VNNRILLVLPWPQYVRKAKAHGYTVYAICDRSRDPEAHLAEIEAHAAAVHDVDRTDVPALRRLVADLARRHRVAHILHLGDEETQGPVCREAVALGLALNPVRALDAVNDKAATRRVLAAHGLSPVRCRVLASPDQVPAAIADLGPPVVVKPTRLDGSRGVRLIRRPGELAEWAQTLAGYRYDGQVLVEEYLRGPEFSVEVLTVDGRHHVIGVTEKLTDGFVESGHCFPADLSPARHAAITDLVTDFLEAAGYRFGPTHTEVKLTDDGPRIIESQARLGGDRIPQLVAVATGFDPESAVFGALAGKPVDTVVAGRLGVIRFFRLAPGLLESVTGLDEIAALPYVHELRFKHQAGDLLPATVDSATRHGFVLIDAASRHEADLRLAAVHSLLRARIRGAAR